MATYKTKQTNYRELVHNPADLAAESVRWAESLENVPGVPFGVPTVDRKVVPFHPGDMVVLCARPGHGKTSLLTFMARAEAKRIQQRGTYKTEAVVYVTFEQVTEEIDAILCATGEYSVSDIVWGRVNLDAVKRNAIKRINLPIWLVGDSLSRTNAHSPRMYPETVFKAIESMEEEFGVRPTLLCIDYIQLIPIPAQADRMKQVIEAAHRVKEIAKRLGCPAVVATQARREVDERTIKIPEQHDAQWSSSIEQTCDKFFGLWRPWVTEPHFSTGGGPNTIEIDGRQVEITKELLVVSLRKQRFEDGAWTWPLHFQPEYLKLCEMEMRHVEPDWS